MALSEVDKAEILVLIRSELEKAFEKLRPGGQAPSLDVRTVGIPIDVSALAGVRRPPVAADQCCNGCD